VEGIGYPSMPWRKDVSNTPVNRVLRNFYVDQVRIELTTISVQGRFASLGTFQPINEEVTDNTSSW